MFTYAFTLKDLMRSFLQHDTILLGVLVAILAIIFHTSNLKGNFWRKFYTYIPSLLLCYFIPSLLNTFDWVDVQASSLYSVAKNYLLPSALLLFCLSIDIKGILKLGPKALIVFFTGTLGIVLGGPIALSLEPHITPAASNVMNSIGFDAEPLPSEELWRGFSTVAGSWIGGGANQTAMKETYEVSDKMFSSMVTVDVIVANIWMALLLLGVGKNSALNRKLKADDSAVKNLQKKLEDIELQNARVSTTTDFMKIIALGLGGTAIAHGLAYAIAPSLGEWVQNSQSLNPIYLSFLGSHFFWVVVLATTFGLTLSFSRAKKLEGAGASKIGSIFLYLLVATLGLRMDITEILNNMGLFVIGLVWMMVHALLLIIVTRVIRAPFFLMAVGSQANVGGAASAPIVASAFSPVLAPVGVLLAVLGYAVGTYAAIICASLMQWISA